MTFSFNNIFNSDSFCRFSTPTRLLVGYKAIDMIHQIVPPKSNSLLVIDYHFLSSPAYHSIKKSIPNIVRELIIKNEPLEAEITEAVRLPGFDNISSIVAVGGGSTIDFAKALTSQRTFGSFKKIGYGDLRVIPDLTPYQIPITLIAVPTTAGTGSESSRYYSFADTASHEKIINRSWSMCPAYCILDPQLISNSPPEILVKSAFDAFSHLWETYICRYESNILTETLTLEGSKLIYRAMNKLYRDEQLLIDDFSGLQIASYWGGVALSNVRTGLLHDAGESLAAKVNLAHPETLFIFLRESLLFYENSFPEKQIRYMRNMNEALNYKTCPLTSLYSIYEFWSKLFKKFNIITPIENKLRESSLNTDFVIDKILADKVLCDKESPKHLDRNFVTQLVNNSVDHFNRTL